MLAAATAITLLFLYARRRGRPDLSPSLARLVTLAAGLVLVQVGLGALVILLEVPIWKAVLHQAVGVLTFTVVTLILWRCAPADNAPALGEPDGLALRGA